ncbi:MAG: elongation factor P, partial [Deltaproteobacteria bacterium]|nr:elongation factor P [Deltaproteobacteria bacterium]
LPNTVVNLTFCGGKPTGLELPSSLEFEVVEAEPGLRTATATASYKQAKIETGHVIKVPQFVQTGDRIKVNPNTDEYVERVKK